MPVKRGAILIASTKGLARAPFTQDKHQVNAVPMSRPKRIIFAGTPAFSVPTLQMLLDSDHDVVAVYTQPDRPAGRGRKLQASPVKQLAESAGVAVYQPLSLRADNAIETLKAHEADLMVVIAYGLLLPQAVLDAPALGCVNVHASLLPRWRGAAPIQRAIIEGDAQTGVTIMQMAAGLDTGPMLYKSHCDITHETTSASLHDSLSVLGAEALKACLPDILSGEIAAEVQNEDLACYAAKLSKAEAVIDWTLPASVIARQVQGYNPWPVAETTLAGDKLRVWQAYPLDTAHSVSPGTVTAQQGAELLIATGEGQLAITQLQLPGKRAVSSADFNNSRQIVGQRLGGE